MMMNCFRLSVICILNFDRYPWLRDLESNEAMAALETARESYKTTGAGESSRVELS